MTRINCVPVAELTRQHLVAEYRELPRLFRLVYNAQKRGETIYSIAGSAPNEYCLGKGHLRFFYTRLNYITSRFYALIAEMKRRGYKVSYKEPPPVYNKLDSIWFGRWTPTKKARAINRKRIKDRLNGV
jgi:hypothetical protein